MTPATRPHDGVRAVRMLHLDPSSAALTDGSLEELHAHLRPGDVLVVNDAGTLPASLRGFAGGEPLEIRLAGPPAGATYTAVLFGAGDWRMRTEHRPPPPRLPVGAHIRFAGLVAEVVGVDRRSSRLVQLRFDLSGERLWRALYRIGVPVQYSHLERALDLWDVQTPFASRPWAMEAPSAGLALSWRSLMQLRRTNVALGRVTHAAGLSHVGDDAIDRLLPLPERFDVPAATVQAIAAARAHGGRVVAVGTTVVRALESAAAKGSLRAGDGVATLRLGETTVLHVVDGILTGLHEPGTSHFALLQAFAPLDLLLRAHRRAERSGYLGHEFGDTMLVLPDTSNAGRTWPRGKAPARR